MTVQDSSSAHKSLTCSVAIDEFQHLQELQTWISIAPGHFLLRELITTNDTNSNTCSGNNTLFSRSPVPYKGRYGKPS